MENFFDDVICFIKHIPLAIFFTISYVVFGVRPYNIMVVWKKSPDEPSISFASTLLPSSLDPTSWESRVYALEHMSEFESICFKSFNFKELQPLPFFDYLWNNVLMSFEF